MNSNHNAKLVSSCDVLIVEDDPDQREEMAAFLGRVGLAVAVAPDCATALRIALEWPPKVAVVDYNLPDGTGLALAERLRAILPHTAIMLASARVEGLSEETLKRVRITVFLNKPLPLNPWRQAVMKLVKEGPPADLQKGWLSGGLGSPRQSAGQ
jgi:CheY-like chemotaxis protein